MPKLKLIIITLVIAIFSIFNGIQVSRMGMKSFLVGFFITFFFSTVVFLFQILYYIATVKHLVANNAMSIEDYQSPLDILLISIPFSILMVITYMFLKWSVVQIYICTTYSLIGMLLANALGRGSTKWSLKKSMPFFVGVIASTLFSVIMEWMI